MSVYEYNGDTAADRAARRQRAQELTSGQRGPDGLTAKEWALLTELRQQGYEIERSWMVNVRRGVEWLHERAIVAIA